MNKRGQEFPSSKRTLNVKYPQIRVREGLGTRKKRINESEGLGEEQTVRKHHKDGGDKTCRKFKSVDNSRLKLHLTHSRHSPF